MALNPLRDALGRRGLPADADAAAFTPEAEAALAGFRARRDELQRAVRRGELTPKVARRLASEAAAEVRERLTAAGDAVPRLFLDRLVEAAAARERSRASTSLEALQRETIRLLQANLVEQQLRSREDEFRARTFVRPVTGGEPSPTLDSLLRFHEAAALGGDEAGREWARRQLEGLRDRVLDPDDQRRIDLACDRPEQVNPRLVARYVEQLEGLSTDEHERFAAEALAAGDSSACVAAFVIARQAPEGPALGWVRGVIDGLDRFPDAALTTLRAWEADAHAAAAETAAAEADRAAGIAAAEAALPGLRPPTAAEVDRLDRLESRPPVAPGESIGLALDRRGLTAEEFQVLRSAEPSADGDPAGDESIS